MDTTLLVNEVLYLDAWTLCGTNADRFYECTLQAGWLLANQAVEEAFRVYG